MQPCGALFSPPLAAVDPVRQESPLGPRCWITDFYRDADIYDMMHIYDMIWYIYDMMPHCRSSSFPTLCSGAVFLSSPYYPLCRWEHILRRTFFLLRNMSKASKPRCMWPFSAGSWPAQICARWLASGNSQVSFQVASQSKILNPVLISSDWIVKTESKVQYQKQNHSL